MKIRLQSSDWVSKILGLREQLGLSQAALAARLHFSAMALSRWENGTHEPSAKATFFWAIWQAILTVYGFGNVLDFRQSMPPTCFRAPELCGQFDAKIDPGLSAIPVVNVPILRATVATPGGKGDSILNLQTLPAEEIIATPESWCPNPSETNCLRVSGDVMKPLINDGDIVAVDCAQTDPARLNGKIIVTWHQEAGLILSRFLFINGAYLLEAESREFQPWQLSNKRNWKIIGRVLWSIRRAP
jgi:transcriptional regulator with XRE-family HTH domain